MTIIYLFLILKKYFMKAKNIKIYFTLKNNSTFYLSCIKNNEMMSQITKNQKKERKNNI